MAGGVLQQAVGGGVGAGDLAGAGVGEGGLAVGEVIAVADGLRVGAVTDVRRPSES
jgi:hypothetical protein